MDPTELAAILGLNEREAAKDEGDQAYEASPVPRAARKPSPHYFELDEWDRQRGQSLWDGDNRDGDGEFSKNVDAAAWADFHAAFYNSDPRPAGVPCETARKAEFLKTLTESPDYHSLRVSTVLNDLTSEMATVQTVCQYHELVEKDERREKDKKFQKKSKEEKEAARESGLMQAVGKAIQQAEQKVEEVEEVARAIGMGEGGGGSPLDVRRLASLHKKACSHATVRRIMKLAGRYRRVAQSRQRQRTGHGLDEVVGVELAGEIGRLLPAELSRLADPDLEWETLRRLAERETVCREHKACEPVGRGPIVVVVDESGSMKGPRVENAKALALALAWVARQQRRWCALVGFSGGSAGTVCVLRPGEANDDQLLSWLSHFYGGGTTWDVPVGKVSGEYWQAFLNEGMPRGKTDVVYVTDGAISVPPEEVDRFLTWKKSEKVRAVTIVLAAEPGGLAAISDEVHEIPELSTACEAVERVLSV